MAFVCCPNIWDIAFYLIICMILFNWIGLDCFRLFIQDESLKNSNFSDKYASKPALSNPFIDTKSWYSNTIIVQVKF